MKKDKRILFLAVPLVVLLAAVSLTGLLTPSVYRLESRNWQVQSKGQDIIDLFLICPALLLTSVMASVNRKRYWQLWAGVNLYLVYTFIIYCFNIHFNMLFPMYCVILGLSFYSLLSGILSGNGLSEPITGVPVNPVQKFTAVFMLATGSIFYLLWCADIARAISAGTVPANVAETGLFTNPVHVLDLSVFLPALIICGILILRGNRRAIVFSPVLLVFMLLMDMTIAFLTLYILHSGLPGSFIIAVVMMITVAVSAWLLLASYKPAARTVTT